MRRCIQVGYDKKRPTTRTISQQVTSDTREELPASNSYDEREGTNKIITETLYSMKNLNAQEPWREDYQYS